MPKGDNLANAEKWFNMAVKYDADGNVPLYEKCINKAIEYEKKGIESGESWD